MSSVAVPLLPRPVFCVIEHAHRDRSVADAVRGGRFNHAGITLDLGVEPDWLTAHLPADPEWRIEWAKFYCGLDLAHAFADSGDPSYRLAWERLVASWIERVPAHHDRADVTARRVLNWIYAWLGFGAALSEGLAERIQDSIADQLEHVRARLTPERNHRTFELYALFLSALALPALDPSGTLLSYAVDELNANLLTDVRPDGVHREASTHYHHVALRTYLGVYENARRFAVDVPGGYRERLERACEFALHCHRPDGTIPALSDSDSGSYLDLLALAASLLGREDFRYVASSGAAGTPPTQRHARFEDGGYFIQRSGWGDGRTPFADERWLILDCGPLGDGGHGHYDLLSIDVAAGGRPLIVDPGRYVYAEDGPNWRRWFKSTAAHNTVCVDGLDQTPYRRGAPHGPTAEGRLLGRLSAPGLDVLWAEATSPRYEVVHRRRVLFVADEYWVVEDHLLGDQAHRFDLRYHLAPSAWGEASLEWMAGQDAVVRAPGFTLIVRSVGHARLEDGWVAPRYGHKVPAPVLSVVADECTTATFTTVIMPRPLDQPAPIVRFGAGGVEVSGVGASPAQRDVVTWSASSAGWVRQCASGAVVRQAICV